MWWSVLYLSEFLLPDIDTETVDSSSIESTFCHPLTRHFLMMSWTCNKCERTFLWGCVCVCVLVKWEHKFFIYKLLLLDNFNSTTYSTRGRGSSQQPGTPKPKCFLVVFPEAGVMISGVIVHLLCISVILPSCVDRYIFYRDIHICV